MVIKIRDKIKQINVADLQKYAKNNKKHPQSQIDILMKNITKFGFTTPLLVDFKNNGEIIAGHGRAIAAEQLGMEKVPCIDVSDLNNDEKKALRIADNKLSELARWDKANLKEELIELNNVDLFEYTGFDMSALNVFGSKKDEQDLEEKLDDVMEQLCPHCGKDINKEPETKPKANTDVEIDDMLEELV